MNPEDKEKLFETSFRFVSWLRNHTGWRSPSGAAGGACRKTLSEERSGICRPLGKVMPHPLFN